MILAKTRSTNPVMKAARGLLSREMSLDGGCARVVLFGMAYALRVTRVVEEGF